MKRACSICVVVLGSDTATLPEWAGGSGLPNARAKGEWFWELMTSRPEAQPWSSVCLAVTKQILYLLGDPHWAGGGVGRGEGAAEFVMCVFSHENCAWKHNTTEEGGFPLFRVVLKSWVGVVLLVLQGGGAGSLLCDLRRRFQLPPPLNTSI